jgi:hypothetical protein
VSDILQLQGETISCAYPETHAIASIDYYTIRINNGDMGIVGAHHGSHWLLDEPSLPVDLARHMPGPGENEQTERDHDRIIERHAADLFQPAFQAHAGRRNRYEGDSGRPALPVDDLKPTHPALPKPVLLVSWRHALLSISRRAIMRPGPTEALFEIDHGIASTI